MRTPRIPAGKKGRHHKRTVHFDSISKRNVAAAKLALHERQRFAALSALLRCWFGALVGLPALAAGKTKNSAFVS